MFFKIYIGGEIKNKLLIENLYKEVKILEEAIHQIIEKINLNSLPGTELPTLYELREQMWDTLRQKERIINEKR